MPPRAKNLVGVNDPRLKAHIVGAYCWYSINDEMVALTKVRRAFRDNGLDVSRLPDERRPEHVAQEACRKVERVTTNGHREEIRAEQVDRNEDFLIYQITRHVQDKANRVIEHPKALRVLFSFADGTLSFQTLEGSKRREVQGLIDQIQEHFDKNQNRMPGHKLRTLLRHYVEAAGAENMRGHSGGVYFMPRTNPLAQGSKLRDHHGDSIDGLEFLDQIKSMLTQVYGRAPEFHRVPCIDDEEQMEFLKRKFLENCAEDLKEYRDECLDLVREKEEGERKRSFRADKRTNLINKRRAIDERRKKFAEILGETLAELDQDMKLADEALTAFIHTADDSEEEEAA